MKRLLLMAVSVGIVFINQGQPEQKIVFLDVGQGDATLLQDGTVQVLVDGGPGMKVLEELGEQMPWMDKTIEVIFLSHPQRDHMEGLLHVLDRYEVGLVIIPRASASSLMQAEWLDRISRKRVNWRYAWEGEVVRAGDIAIGVMGPTGDQISGGYKDVNDVSVILRAEFNGLNLLLTGDAGSAQEKSLVGRAGVELSDVNVFKAGHHGSKTSNSQSLIDVATPQIVVISVGADNSYGHPSEEVLRRFDNVSVWRTDENGAVNLSFVDNQWLVGSEH